MSVIIDVCVVQKIHLPSVLGVKSVKGNTSPLSIQSCSVFEILAVEMSAFS